LSRSSTSLRGWVAHRLVANYWFLAICAVIAAPLAFALSLALDRRYLSDWLIAHDLAPVATADTAKEVASVIAGIDAAFITLYFSISLIVLTIAAGNLGVRLIDRWLGRHLVRVSIAGLSFSLIFAVLTLAAIDAEAPLAETPLATLSITILLLAVNVAMLAVALHDLGRTMFVDKAIDALAGDAIDGIRAIAGRAPFSGTFAQTVAAPRDGYVEGVDLDRLVDRLAGHEGAVRICVAPGQHVLKGEPLAQFERRLPSAGAVKKALPIGPFRSDRQGSVFQIRLIVEIAARALSPAVNDFYTALAAADALAEIILRHRESWVDPEQIAVSADHPRFELPGQDFHGLFGDPLNAFRQAAADYPAVSIRMIDNYGRVMRCVSEAGGSPRLASYLADCARALRDHAEDRAQAERDREEIRNAFARAVSAGD